MEQLLLEYLQILMDMFKYDVEVFSQGWIYYCLLIPVTFYVAFFFAKWAVLTAPVWLPIVIIFQSLSAFLHSIVSIFKRP